jgi:replication factor A1
MDNYNFIPIRMIGSITNNWTIKARVTSKSDIKEWNNERSQGKLFKITVLDIYNDEIEAVFFNEAVDDWFDLIETSKVYSFSNGSIKPVNKMFNNVDHSYSISFSKGASILEEEDDNTIPYIKLNIV